MTSLNLHEQKTRQQEIITFLMNCVALWDTLASRTENLEIIETHGATVLLGVEIALKIKKAVHFDHMDYGTADKRRHFCERELSINKRSAPDLYLGVQSVCYDPDTGYSLDGSGETVDYFLKMRRFPKGSRLDQIAARGELSPLLLDDLTDAVLSFHKQTDIVQDPDKVPNFHQVIDANFLQLDDFCPKLLDLTSVLAFRETLHAFVDSSSSLLSNRINSKWVRWGHGDLHLQNICVLGNKPILFDAIEYQDEFVISDILYDLSFLLMDLWEKDLRPAANRVFNRYLNGIGWTNETTALNGLKLLPFYLSMRAGIRTHVEGRRFNQSESQDLKAQFATNTSKLFKASQRYLAPRKAQLVAIGGFSGSGKSTLASNLAPYLGAAPGAVHIRSDVIRRQIMDWDEFSPMAQSAYTSEISQRVYNRMMDIAGSVLDAGHSVIMDAVLDRETDRVSFETVAKVRNVPFTGIWLEVAKNTMASRIEGRKRDASDATVKVLENQISRSEKQSQTWHQLDGNGTPQQSLSLSLALFEDKTL